MENLFALADFYSFFKHFGRKQHFNIAYFFIVYKNAALLNKSAGFALA